MAETMNSIAIASSKGGTGKTTVALNLAVALAEKGHATLLVDVDSQGAVGLSLARSDTEWAGLAELMMEDAELDPLIVQTRLQPFHLLARGRVGAADAPLFEQSLVDSSVLEKVFEAVRDRFDYVIVDTPSGVGPGTRAALRACDYVLIPVQAEHIALRSLSQILSVVEHVQSHENHKLRLLGLLPTMVDLGKENCVSVMSEVWTGFSGVMESFIPRAEVFAKASRAGLPLSFLGGPTTPEARRFDMLAAEVENSIAAFSDSIGETHERAQREIL
jgi:chromosome partitioning protein